MHTGNGCVTITRMLGCYLIPRPTEQNARHPNTHGRWEQTQALFFETSTTIISAAQGWTTHLVLQHAFPDHPTGLSLTPAAHEASSSVRMRLSTNHDMSSWVSTAATWQRCSPCPVPVMQQQTHLAQSAQRCGEPHRLPKLLECNNALKQ